MRQCFKNDMVNNKKGYDTINDKKIYDTINDINMLDTVRKTIYCSHSKIMHARFTYSTGRLKKMRCAATNARNDTQ